MDTTLLDRLEAIPTPFDDVFDPELLRCGPVQEALAIWTHCGRRLDLIASCIGWQTLSLREVVDDVQATWSGADDAAWDSDAYSN